MRDFLVLGSNLCVAGEGGQHQNQFFRPSAAVDLSNLHTLMSNIGVTQVYKQFIFHSELQIPGMGHFTVQEIIMETWTSRVVGKF